MGIGAKRTTEELKGKMKNFEKRLHDSSKANFSIEVDWDSLVNEDNHHYAASSFEKIFIYTMEEVFKEVCKDNIGAEAVAAGLKKIVMTNKGNNKSSHNWASLSEGCLTLDHWLGNADFVHDRSVNAKSVLESSL